MVLGMSAAAAAAGAHELFSYNRENFLFDRKMRQETEFQILEWRSTQAELWRDDVREIVGLTEKKMDNYLLVGTLQLGMCLALFSEGRLEPGTPPWLLHFYMLTLGGTFVYLLMSVWLAMHASIAASCSSVKLLTQFVRLPVPTWQQLQEMRTYAESYETIAPRKMLRIPFTGGSPSRASRAAPPSPSRSASKGSPAAGGSACGSPAASRSPPARGGPAALGGSPAIAAADPWDRELHGVFRDLEELRERPAALRRHVALAKQAAVQFQCFDAFARVAMTFGTNQLLSAISYYILGYVAVQDGAPWPAWSMVAIMMAITVGMIGLDFSLTRVEKMIAQLLAVAGPVCASLAAGLWTLRGPKAGQLLMPLLACAFAAHGLWLLFALSICGIQQQSGGAVLPTKFRAVLYLDVFGWWSKDNGARSEGCDADAACSSYGLASQDFGSARLADRAAAYESSRAALRPPEDFAAPREERAVGEHHFEATSFAGHAQPNPDNRSEQSLHAAPDRALPSRAPAMVFRGGTMMLIALWAVSLALPFGMLQTFMTKPLTAKIFVEEIEENTPGGQPRVKTREVEAVVGTQPDGLPELIPEVTETSKDVPELPAGSLIDVAWPRHSGFVPRSLSCDQDGKQFVIADDLGIFSGALTPRLTSSEGQPRQLLRARAGLVGASRRLEDKQGVGDGAAAAEESVSFMRAPPCKALEGQALNDVSVVCPTHGRGPCRVAVLLGGHRLVDCPLAGPPAGSALGMRALLQQEDRPAWQISSDWLRRHHGGPEFLESMAVDSQCLREGAEDGSRVLSGGSFPLVAQDDLWLTRPGCVVVGTSSGRIVQLRASSTDDRRLVPERSVQERVQTVARGALHVFANGLFIALRHLAGSVEAFDSASGASVAQWRLPAGVQWLTLCAGGDSIFALGLRNGTNVELRRFPLPDLLKLPPSSLPRKEVHGWRLGTVLGGGLSATHSGAEVEPR